MNHILLIGSGRLATHLHHYFSQLNISFSTWDRAQDPHLLKSKIEKASHILLAISDSAIESFYIKHIAGFDKTVVHFSGALNIPDLACAHPLMTFGPELYDVAIYQKIHFSITGADKLNSLIPGLKNSYSVLPGHLKAKYHAHCVAGGNFVSILSAEFLEAMTTLEIPKEAALLFLIQSIKNTEEKGWDAITGPLVRNDQITIQKNLEALNGTNLAQIYHAFQHTYQNKWGLK